MTGFCRIEDAVFALENTSTETCHRNMPDNYVFFAFLVRDLYSFVVTFQCFLDSDGGDRADEKSHEEIQ